MKTFSLFITVLLFIKISYAQSNLNPDLSLIGTFNTFTDNVKNTPEYGKLNFDTPGMEFFIDGYLNPYSRASANIAFHEGEFHLEEIYANVVRGLPLDMQIKAGKYLVGFGKINTIHEHAWPFLDRPLFHQVYFGEEGFNDIGVNFNFILPIETFYTDLNLGIFKGDVFSGVHSHAHEEEETDTHDRGNSPIFVGRLGSFFSIDDFTNLEVGLSGSYGISSKMHFNTLGDSTAEHESKALKYFYGGFDFKLKYRPDSYTTLTIQGEGFLNHRDVLRAGNLGVNIPVDNKEKINTYGAYLFIDYLFSKQFSVGAKYDFTYGIVSDELSFNTLSNDDKNKTHGPSAWIGYYPVEETLAVRLGIQNLTFNYSDGTQREDELKVTLQLLFSLGPHKAHPF